MSADDADAVPDTEAVGPVRMAAYELRQLTACRCESDYTARGRHHPTECAAEYRDDVDTLVRAALARDEPVAPAVRSAATWLLSAIGQERAGAVGAVTPAADALRYALARGVPAPTDEPRPADGWADLPTPEDVAAQISRNRAGSDTR